MNAREQAKYRWDHVAKPLHSLGKLEDLIVQIAGIQQTAQVRLEKRCALIFCADHGVVAEGVTQSGSDVTAKVAGSIAAGTANINLMAEAAGADVFAVDMGMLTQVPGTIEKRIAAGTANMAIGPAMTRDQALSAIQAGMELVGEMRERGYRVITTGEMGIGNTTASAALTCALLHADPEAMTGRGAGLSDAGLLRKQHAISRAIAINQPDADDPVDVLAKLGGYEIAGMAGAFLGGEKFGVSIVIDGVISAVAALLAVRINPAAKEFILPSHMSREPAMIRLMEEMNMQPILHADLALGEGTGAIALLPLLDMALKVYNGSHTFQDLDMEAYRPQEEEA